MKKTLLTLMIVLIASFSQLKAALPEIILPAPKLKHSNQKLYEHEYMLKSQTRELRPTFKRPYNVLSYNLYVDWFGILNDPQNRVYEAKNIITLQIDSSGVNFLDFDSQNQIISSVLINSEVINNFSLKNGILSLPLAKTASIGDTFIVSIDYYYKNNDTLLGLYLYPKNHFVGFGPMGDSVFTEENIAYTMSEPQEARYWMPCNDNPADKAISTISVRVPEGYTAVSNGLLVNKHENIDVGIIYEWHEELPIATYLMSITASKFDHYSDYYKKVSNPNDSIEVQYYYWAADSASTVNLGYNAKYAFRNTVEMMKAYSTIFTEYPFSKYGMAAVQPFNYGGMEHQTITTISRQWLRGWYDYGIAHELAHQWLGDLITCADWSDIWINEGGASWSEAVWMEYLYGHDTYYKYMNSHKDEYFDQSNSFFLPIYGGEYSILFEQPSVALIYNKASWIYHQLREMLGDEQFFPILRKLFVEYAYQPVSTQDFIAHFKKYAVNTRVDLNVFFDQWLLHSGHPIYKIESVQTDAGNGGDYVKVTLKQKPIYAGMSIAYAPEVFVMPIDLLFYCGDTVYVKEVVNDQLEQEYNFYIESRIDSVKIDYRKILAEDNGNTLSVKEINTNSGSFNVFPNPSRNSETVKLKFDNNINSEINIELYDLNGNLVQFIEKSFLNTGSYEINFVPDNLPSGVYSLRISGKNGVIRTALISLVN